MASLSSRTRPWSFALGFVGMVVARRLLCIVPLSDAWAQRRFAICYRGEQALSPAAQLLVQHLARASAHEAPEALA